MSPLKVGVAGCGQIALSVHLKNLSHLPGLELAAFADIDAQKRVQAHSIAPQAAVFSDYREMLGLPQLDAIIICLPNALHAEAAIAALGAGKHIYIEKPLATSLEEGRRILTSWRRSGRIGMIGFNYRFNPLYRELRRQMLSGRIGEAVAVRSVFSSARSHVEAWRHNRDVGGGALLDLASHHIDLTRFMFGQEIAAVSTSLRSARSEDDTAVVQMLLSVGPFVQSLFSLSTLEEDCYQVYGEFGKLAVDRYRSSYVEYSPVKRASDRFAMLGSSARSLFHVPFRFEKLRAVGHEPSYRVALHQFAEAVRTGQTVSPDLEDGFRSLAVVLAAEESAATGKLVAVSAGTVSS